MELLHQILGHIYTRSLLDVDTEKNLQDIELRVDPDPFRTSCQIYMVNEKARSKTLLKAKTPFKWVFMDILSSTFYKSLTKDTHFDNYSLILDAYYIISIFHRMENIITDEVMGKLDMFQEIFVKAI